MMGRTVLHVAASWGDVNGARACLHMGAYVDAVDAKRDVPYDLAWRDGHRMAFDNAHLTTGIGRRRRGRIDDHGAAVLEESIGGGEKEEDDESKEEYFYEMYQPDDNGGRGAERDNSDC